ncbi:MAG TPA: heavy metal sensor histidine kinase [Thermoanaerobaculia bacterium]|nr:heavy metal sensor histidine kinase [Thermoanaerobaculia bacterium]
MRSRLSIFGALVLWFTAAGILIIAGVSFFLFRAFERSRMREESRALAARVQSVVTGLESADDQDLSEELDRIRASVERENAIHPRGLGVSIQENDRVLLKAGFIPGNARFPPPASHPSTTAVPVARRDPDGEHTYLLTSAEVNRANHRYVIHVAVDETADQEALDDFRMNTYSALGIGTVLAALAGALVARRAMRPLARITAATQSVDVGRLEHRLDDETWPAELQALATEFGSMQTRLRESFQRLAAFSDDLAHELRTPVNNLMGAAEVALGQPRSGDEYRETLGSILEETQRLRRMIDELLFLARAEHPERSLERAALDAREDAAAIAEFFSGVAEEKKIALSVEGGGTVLADRSLFRRALSNLVGNALQYTPPGGSVRIVIRPSEVDTRIEVHDTGAGIESRHLGHLFDRFYRVDEARSGHTEGTGLGLSIVRSIAALHGGTVEVESKPGRGSIFTLRFPAAPAPPAPVGQRRT